MTVEEWKVSAVPNEVELICFYIYSTYVCRERNKAGSEILRQENYSQQSVCLGEKNWVWFLKMETDFANEIEFKGDTMLIRQRQPRYKHQDKYVLRRCV